MKTIIIKQGQVVQPEQYSKQIDIGKVIIHEGAIIGNKAFEYCIGITEIIIAQDATIKKGAFQYCTGITELTIAEGATIGDGTFWECIGITEVNIAKNVTIGKAAFGCCISITRVSIASGVTIDKSALGHCQRIGELMIAEDVEFGNHASCFNTVEQFSMFNSIMYFSRQLILSVSELVKTLREKGHEADNIRITNRGLVPHQGIQSLQSLCVKTIVGSDGIKDLSMANSIIRSQQLLASEETKKQRLFILERNDKCTKENCKANELYAMIQTHK